jgi:hypothetical protein
MKKSATVWMAVLTLTAIILGAILFSSSSRQAQAAMLNAQSNVTMMTSGIASGADEVVVVVDKVGMKMAVYLLKGNELVMIAGKNMGK